MMTATGEWRQFRGDRALTGRSPLSGDITAPAICWRQFVGARETLVGARLQPGAETALPLPSQDVPATDYDALIQQWETGDPWYDLDGDGRLQRISLPPDGGTSTYKIGKFIPDESGLQMLEFESGFNKEGGTVADPAFKMYGRLFVRRDGVWQQRWESESIPLLYRPNVVVGDFDNDGALEVAVVPWYDLWVLDVATGATKAKGRFTPPGTESGRAYGWLGAFDLNGDGRQEFVIIAQFENSIEVMDWQNGQPALRWHRLIQKGIMHKHTALRCCSRPVQDIDGDGLPEIVVSVYNETGDERWHVLAFDGMTGAVKLDLPNALLTDLIDLDGDGVAELCCTRPHGVVVPLAGELSVISAKVGQPVVRWQAFGAAFQTQADQRLPLHINRDIGAADEALAWGRIDVMGRSVFFTRQAIAEAPDETRLTIWHTGEDGIIRQVGLLRGPRVAVVATREDGVLLLRAQGSDDAPTKLVGENIALQTLLSRRVGVPPSVPIVGRLTSGAAPVVIAEGAGDTLVVIENPAGHATFRRIAGRGIRKTIPAHGSGVTRDGAVLADVDGDGALTMLLSTWEVDGQGQLTAVAPDGRRRWSHLFSGLPAMPHTEGYSGGVSVWTAGYFRDDARQDVLVSIRPNTLHSEETFLLDGRTGETVWHRTNGHNSGDHQCACGGSWIALGDIDGDGLDDIFQVFPFGIFVMHGATGRPLLNKSTINTYVPTWSFYAIPVVMDFLRDGRMQFLYASSTYMLALLDVEGNAYWASGASIGPPAILPGIGDIDGDDRLELLGPGYRRESSTNAQDFRCYDASTGALKWMLPLPGSCFGYNNQVYPDSPASPMVADLDGDGREECVFGIGNTLYCLGATSDGTTGEIRWTMDFPTRIGPAALADVAGDGTLQIVVTCEDGFVYGIGNR